jgi:site-specific recombinase XerD
MSKSAQGQLIRLVHKSELARDVQSFVIDRQARGLSPRTIEFYSEELHFWQTYLECQGLNHVEELTPGHLREYLLKLAERRNPGGVHAAFRAMRAFLNWYEVEYEPQEWSNPIRKVAAPRVPQRQLDPVSLSDLKTMLATCERRTLIGDRDRAMLLALLDTGCRASEFLALNLGDVNLHSGAVIVRNAKGGKFRTAFLGAKTRRELGRYLRHRASTSANEPLWLTVHGKRLSYCGLRSVLRRRSKRAGIDEPTLHSLRRAFALTCLRGGMDVYSLQKLMGHSDLSVLRRYLQQTEADLRLAHQKVGPVDSYL